MYPEDDSGTHSGQHVHCIRDIMLESSIRSISDSVVDDETTPHSTSHNHTIEHIAFLSASIRYKLK